MTLGNNFVLPYKLKIPFLMILDIYPKEQFLHSAVGMCRSFLAVLFIRAKSWKHHQKVKLWCSETMEYYTAEKKDGLQL